jgi:hypothetical protein
LSIFKIVQIVSKTILISKKKSERKVKVYILYFSKTISSKAAKILAVDKPVLVQLIPSPKSI